MRIDYVNELRRLKDTSAGLLFLYPLLQLDKKINPIGVYMGFQNVETEDLLICLFNEKQHEFNSDWLNYFKNHPLYLCQYKEEDYYYVIFEFVQHSKFYTSILKGAYSKITDEYKLMLDNKENPLTQIALFPEEHYTKIADDLEIDIDYLIGQEIVPPPNNLKDYIHLSKQLKEQIELDF